MKLLVYLGHPAHFHLFRQVILKARDEGHQVTILARKKDVLEDLLRAEGLPYANILPKGRPDTKLGMLRAMSTRELAILRRVLVDRPTVMTGTCAEIAHVGKLLGIPSVVVNEDDHDVVPLFAKLAYPLCTHILAPACCLMGKWKAKTVFYDGYHELAYLHPNHFQPDREVVREFHSSEEPYFLVRFAKLTAHHDEGRSGLSGEVARRLVKTLLRKGSVYITSERLLEPEFEQYRIQIPPAKIHHALAFAGLYVGDSQTMAAEAAVLGTPSVRFNDFVGEIGYLEELEHRYGLTRGIRTSEPEEMLRVVDTFSEPGARTLWAKRRERMLAEKVDVAAFLGWFLGEYPASVKLLNSDPECAGRFTGLTAPAASDGRI